MSYTTSRSASALENMASQAGELLERPAVDQTSYRFAIVLLVELPNGTELDLRSPISNLAASEGQLSAQVVRLCRIVYHDNTVPMLSCPVVVGQQATGMDAVLIEAHRHHGKVAYASNTDLAIPAPGDLIEIKYANPIAKTGAVYERLAIPTPNPGQPASSQALTSLSESLPFTSLESYGSSEEAIAALLGFIAKGEGGYNSMNQGTSDDDEIIGSTDDASTILGKNLTEMTIAEIKTFQAHPRFHAQRLFAAGRYQMIPGTLAMAVSNSSGVSDTTIFNEATQDTLGTTLLFNGQRPDLSAYLQGRSNDLNAAMLDMAKEWASVPDPSTGDSWHGSGNRAQHSVEEVSAALQSARGGITGGSS